MYEFYLIETPKKQKAETVLKSKELKNLLDLKKATIKNVSQQYNHVLSHQNLYAVFYRIELGDKQSLKELKKVKLSEINKYAFPRLIEKYLKDENIIK